MTRSATYFDATSWLLASQILNTKHFLGLWYDKLTWKSSPNTESLILPMLGVLCPKIRALLLRIVHFDRLTILLCLTSGPRAWLSKLFNFTTKPQPGQGHLMVLSGHSFSWVTRSFSIILTLHPWSANLHLCWTCSIRAPAKLLVMLGGIGCRQVGQSFTLVLHGRQTMWPEGQLGIGSSRGMLKHTGHSK